MKFATLPRILRRRLQTSTSQSAKSLRLPRETHRFGASSNPPRLPTFLQPSRTPAPAMSKSLRLPRETHFQPPKTSRDRQFLTILTSESLSRAGVVQILRSSTSKSASVVPFFRKNRSRAQAWCKFCEAQLPKVLRTCQRLTILTSESLWRAGVVQILSTSWAADPSHHLAFRTYLCEPSKPRNYGKTQHFAQFLPAKISPVSHLRCKTSLLSNIDDARPTGNFQYSRKLELLNFLWP